MTEAVGRSAVEMLGDRYVDISVNPDQDHFIVGVLDLRPEEIDLLQDALTGTGVPVQVASREVGRAELDESAARVCEALKDITWSSLAVDYRAGMIEVGLPAEAQRGEAAAALTRAGVEDAVTFRSEPIPTPQDAVNTLPMMAGKYILVGAGACTSGFKVRDVTFEQPAILTAGHCGVNGSVVAPAGNPTNTSE